MHLKFVKFVTSHVSSCDLESIYIMQQNEPYNTKGSGIKFSVRNPRNVWLVRVTLLVLVVLGLDLSDNSMSEKLPRKSERWAKNWIALNELSKHYEVRLDESQELFAVENKVSVVSYGGNVPNETLPKKGVTPRNILPNKQVLYAENTREKIEPTSTNNAIVVPGLVVPDNEIEVNQFFQNESVINEEEEYYSESTLVSEPIDYEKALQESYAEASENKVLVPIKEKSGIDWLATGSIGPQMSQGVVNQPSGSAYANSSSIANITSDPVGSGGNTMDQSFSASLNLGISLGSKFELLSGVNYTQMDGSHMAYYDSKVKKTQTIITSKPTKNTDGTSSIETYEEQVNYTNYFSDTISANYRITSFEIPLILKYNFGKQKLSYFMSSGVSANISNSYSALYESNEIGSGDINEESFGVHSINLIVGIGMQYRATKHISIKLSPGYKYGIPITSSSAFKTPISSVGLFTGLSYYFE